MSKDLSQIAADVFARSTQSRELASQVQRVGEEIRNALHSDDTMSGKFRGLLEALGAVLPDEQQRYNAALQAISSTSKLSRPEIISAVSGELEELRTVEQRLKATVQAWRDALKGMEARSQQLKGEIAHLRQRLGQLESEEQTIVTAEGQGLAEAERTVRELFANSREEMSSLSRKIEELTTEEAAPRKEAVKSSAPVPKKKVGGQKAAVRGPAPKQASDEVQARGKEKEAAPAAPTLPEAPGPAAEPSLPDAEPASAAREATGTKKGSSRSGSQPGGKKKKSCPVCYKQMVWSPGEKVWRCPAGPHGSRR